jgi:nicotinamide-nucleotide amidase
LTDPDPRNDECVVEILTTLGRQGRTLAVAESCTGGGLGVALTTVPGSSRVFVGGVIAYSNSVKTGLLGVSPDVVETQGAVSADSAAAMAIGVKKATGADWGIAITGIAGPDGGDPDKPVGTVWIGASGPGQDAARCERHVFPGGRTEIRSSSVHAALDLLSRAVGESDD